MKNFILIMLLCVALFYVSKSEPMYALGLLVLCAVIFIVLTNITVTEQDMKYRKRIIEDPKSRYRYYQNINSGSE